MSRKLFSKSYLTVMMGWLPAAQQVAVLMVNGRQFEDLNKGHSLKRAANHGRGADCRGDTERVLDGYVGWFGWDVGVIHFNIFDEMNFRLQHGLASFATQERVDISEIFFALELFLDSEVAPCIERIADALWTTTTSARRSSAVEPARSLAVVGSGIGTSVVGSEIGTTVVGGRRQWNRHGRWRSSAVESARSSAVVGSGIGTVVGGRR